jgi:hypothetical protein
VQAAQEHDADGDFDAVVARLSEELGSAAADVPPPPPPARPPGRLGRLRTRLSVAVWRFRAALPEPVKTPIRRLLRRPAPAALEQPAQPSDLTRAVEDLQLERTELARRVTELEDRLAALEAGRRRTRTKPPAS